MSPNVQYINKENLMYLCIEVIISQKEEILSIVQKNGGTENHHVKQNKPESER